MTRIYMTPFHSEASQTASNIMMEEGRWPYDNGDDPSFCAMRKHAGQLTWGVCRQDIRNKISEGDIVLFFSFCKYSNGISEYRFCCIATVERKVSQADIWQRKELTAYRKYCNLLIQPPRLEGGWEHFEPCLEGRRRHKDWLWRTVVHAGLRKKEFESISTQNQFKSGTKIEGHSITLARNYVLFSSDPLKTLVVARPRVIANFRSDRKYETWNKDKFSQEIKKLTLDKANQVNAGKRWLRTQNIQRPHRQIVFELTQHDADNWRARVLRLIGRENREAVGDLNNRRSCDIPRRRRQDPIDGENINHIV
jgi:hypothetical protein